MSIVVLCGACSGPMRGMTFHPKGVEGHTQCVAVPSFTGLYLLPDFVEEEEEAVLAALLENDPNWKESQSGRRKIDYGPSANFKKKKLKVGHFRGLPRYAKQFIFDKIDQLRLQPSDDAGLEGFKKKMEGFCPAEVNVLRYELEKGSNLASHFDDFWLWGERIIGLNLLSDTVLTYSRPDDPGLLVQVPIPRRSLYLMSEKSRSEWQHGIFAEDIHGKRFVVTVRELSAEFMDFDCQPIGQELLTIASTFL